jgi:hypothetical protein
MRIFLRKENNETASNPVRAILRGDNKPLEATSVANGRTTNEIKNVSSPIGKTVGEMQSEPISTWGNADIITGLKFCATMKLQTPLRVLKRHGEVHQGVDQPPPLIAREAWEGIWVPKTKTFRELGLDREEPAPTTMASDVGPIPTDGGKYLKFLLAVRSLVEADASVLVRREQLRKELETPQWVEFAAKLGGKQKIIDCFFPPFLAAIARISLGAVAALRERGVVTPSMVATVADADLLAIKGVGPVKLKAIRDACAAATDQSAEFIDLVAR